MANVEYQSVLTRSFQYIPYFEIFFIFIRIRRLELIVGEKHI